MRSINNLLKSTGASIITFMTLDSYRRAVINDSKNKQTDLLIKESLDKYKSAVAELEKKESLIDYKKVENSAILDRIREKSATINNDIKSINSSSSDAFVKGKIESVQETATSLTQEVKKLLEKTGFEPGSSKFYPISYIQEIIDSYSTVELGAISHIVSSLFILICMWYIITAYYGDKLILYLKLEDKYPKLSKWIKLRRKFQNYYINVNMLLITITLLYIIFINVLVLYYN